MIKVILDKKEIENLLSLRFNINQIESISSINTLKETNDNGLYFINKDLDETFITSISSKLESLFLVKDTIKNKEIAKSYKNIVTIGNIRIAMSAILEYIDINKNYTLPFLKYKYTCKKTDSNYPFVIIGENVTIDKGVIIEPFVFLGDNIWIKQGSIVKSGVRGVRNTQIGKNCIIRENSVIGGNGFGIEKDELGNNRRLPHLGGVIVGDNVEIGALNTICSGTISATIVENYVKTDDHVHVAHNDHIKENTIITAGTIVSGSVTLGKSVWMGPNSTIINGVELGDEVFSGIGSVITKSFNEKQTIAGNPARKIEEYKQINLAIKKLLPNNKN